MDGTLLDLNYDNALWNGLLPKRFASARGISDRTARNLLYGNPISKFDYYSIDYWQDFTNLDMVSMHMELTHLIQYRANAKSLISKLRKLGIRCVIATNAHPKVFEIKNQVTLLDKIIDSVYCAHDFSTTKEDLKFWVRFQNIERFDPKRTLFIDDNIEVLDTARRYGILNLLAIEQPDSSKPVIKKSRYKSIANFSQIFPHD